MYNNGKERQEDMIKVENLKLILNKRSILTDIDLCFEEGKIYGLTGNNGCGKTMLMKCICGFVKPSSGSVICEGKRVGKDIDYLADTGIIIENPCFIGYYPGFKNLKLLAGIKNKPDPVRIKETMKTCGLDPDLRLPVRKYSLGMRQRLGIAQAIMEDQKILILDEPMNGLDIDGISEMRELLLRLKNEGKLIILASHNTEDIRILCDDIIKMDKGRIVEIRHG